MKFNGMLMSEREKSRSQMEFKPSKRYKVRFPSAEAMEAAMAIQDETMVIPVIHSKRQIISMEPPDANDIFADALESPIRLFEKEYGATYDVDYQYELDSPPFDIDFSQPDQDGAKEADLNDVMAQIRADQVRGESEGKGVTIAVVDTGIDGSRPEFAKNRRVGAWQTHGDKPWTDWKGHGTMCAAIAAGSKSDGGVFDGVAPKAGLIACKTHFFDSELAAIYDYLIEFAEQGRIIVATNSFGKNTGSAPRPQDQSDFIDALNDAIVAGIHVFFSAGNNHERANGLHGDCQPNSIWLHKSRSDIMAVAACKLDRSMWFYSSRGPGQHFGDPHTNRKPDVTAPTPKNGQVVYGNSLQVKPNGWGTSGACPQAAGLAALLLAKRPTLKHNTLFDLIRSSATSIGHSMECEGHGLIDCQAALTALANHET